ncbi:UNVERIFIED_CONTAM: hypothetical protein GTU68_018028 [Idotea baltica]|nr:hypothetical protein [Idotea baltica]
MGNIGTTSFFPAKNLGCYGDGGALFTNSDNLNEKIRMIANHGMKTRYFHEVVGLNSRLDAIQAAVLNIKLAHLNTYGKSRQKVAAAYDQAFAHIDQLQVPQRQHNSTHVFHQYTMKVKNGRRDALAHALTTDQIAHGIYYPVPMHKQKAFAQFVPKNYSLPITEQLCGEVISLPIHTEMKGEHQDRIIDSIIKFFN